VRSINCINTTATYSFDGTFFSENDSELAGFSHQRRRSTGSLARIGIFGFFHKLNTDGNGHLFQKIGENGG
jgi:hypothetical protein